VGHHVDVQLCGVDASKVAATLDWFYSCVTSINQVVSFHRPTPEVLGRGYGAFQSSYGPDIFAIDRYLSDSRRSAAFWPQLLEWLSEARSPVQLLLHPEWWLATNSGAAIRDTIHARPRHELDRDGSLLITRFTGVGIEGFDLGEPLEGGGREVTRRHIVERYPASVSHDAKEIRARP
jgi:hypothetical protein